MTKDEFIVRLAKQIQTSKTQAEEQFNHCINALKQLLMAGEELTIPGFGKFMTRRREARVTRHPQTGQPLSVGEKVVPVFKPGDALKMKVTNALRSREPS